MATAIAKTSKDTICRMFRNEFEKIDKSMDYIFNRSGILIQAAKDYGLNDLAEELKADL